MYGRVKLAVFTGSHAEELLRGVPVFTDAKVLPYLAQKAVYPPSLLPALHEGAPPLHLPQLVLVPSAPPAVVSATSYARFFLSLWDHFDAHLVQLVQSDQSTAITALGHIADELQHISVAVAGFHATTTASNKRIGLDAQSMTTKANVHGVSFVNAVRVLLHKFTLSRMVALVDIVYSNIDTAACQEDLGHVVATLQQGGAVRGPTTDWMSGLSNLVRLSLAPATAYEVRLSIVFALSADLPTTTGITAMTFLTGDGLRDKILANIHLPSDAPAYLHTLLDSLRDNARIALSDYVHSLKRKLTGFANPKRMMRRLERNFTNLAEDAARDVWENSDTILDPWIMAVKEGDVGITKAVVGAFRDTMADFLERFTDMGIEGVEDMLAGLGPAGDALLEDGALVARSLLKVSTISATVVGKLRSLGPPTDAAEEDAIAGEEDEAVDAAGESTVDEASAEAAAQDLTTTTGGSDLVESSALDQSVTNTAAADVADVAETDAAEAAVEAVPKTFATIAKDAVKSAAKKAVTRITEDTAVGVAEDVTETAFGSLAAESVGLLDGAAMGPIGIAFDVVVIIGTILYTLLSSKAKERRAADAALKQRQFHDMYVRQDSKLLGTVLSSVTRSAYDSIFNPYRRDVHGKLMLAMIAEAMKKFDAHNFVLHAKQSMKGISCVVQTGDGSYTEASLTRGIFIGLVFDRHADRALLGDMRDHEHMSKAETALMALPFGPKHMYWPMRVVVYHESSVQWSHALETARTQLQNKALAQPLERTEHALASLDDPAYQRQHGFRHRAEFWSMYNTYRAVGPDYADHIATQMNKLFNSSNLNFEVFYHVVEKMLHALAHASYVVPATIFGLGFETAYRMTGHK